MDFYSWILVLIGFSTLVLIVTVAITKWQASEEPIMLRVPKWQAPAATEKLRERLLLAGLLNVTPGMFISMIAGATGVFAIALLLITGRFPAILLAPILTVPTGFMYLGIRQRSRTKRASQELVPFLWKIYAALKAGRSHRTAMEDALMGGSGENRDPRDSDTPLMSTTLRPLLRALSAQEPMTTALPASLELLPTSGWERMVRRFLIYEERGGDMPSIVRQAIDDENRALLLQAELRSAYTSVVRDQRTITAGSLVLLPFVHFMMGGLLTPLFTNPIGWLILLIGAGIMVGGIYYAQSKVRSIEEKLDF